VSQNRPNHFGRVAKGQKAKGQKSDRRPATASERAGFNDPVRRSAARTTSTIGAPALNTKKQ
jgi:hypothetical protein